MTETLQQTLSRVKEFGQSHGVDFKSELLAYDHKRRGIITPVALHKWIASLGISVPNRSIQQIIMAYQKGDGLDAVKLIEDLEKASTLTATYRAQPAQSNISGELVQLGKELTRRRQNLREVLAPYDRWNSGKVNLNNFCRALGTAPYILVISAAYAIGQEIDYFKLAEDVKTAVRIHGGAKKEIPKETQAFAEFATWVKTHSIDVKLALSAREDLDPLHTGKLPLKRFLAVISPLHPNLQPRALEQIGDSFGDGIEVDYLLFLEALDKFVPAAPRASQRSFEIPAELKRAKDPRELLNNISHAVEERRINVDAHFSVIEREGGDAEVCAYPRFVRIVQGMHVDLSPEEIETIAPLFRNERGQVKYRAFADSIKRKSTGHIITAADVIERLKAHSTGSHLSFAWSASRFDRENSGSISGQQLASALQFIHFDYSPQDIAALREAYPGAYSGSVNWRLLAAEVDSSRSARISLLDVQTRALEDRERSETSSLPPRAVIRIIQQVVRLASIDRADLAERFRPADRQRLGYISQDAFLTVIRTILPVVRPAEMTALRSFYGITGSSDVDYVRFCRDARNIDQLAKILDASEEIAPIAQVPQREKLPRVVSQGVHQFLKRFKSYCEQMRFAPGDIFSPYDMGHNGTIPVYKVQAALNNARFEVMRGEVEEVARSFRDEKKAELFNYADLVEALKYEDIKSPEVRASLASAPISAEVEREALTTCSQIREKLLARHRNIRQAFAGACEEGIPLSEFLERLARVNLVLRAGELQSVVRKFRMNLSDSIDWNAFCVQVEQSKTI